METSNIIAFVPPTLFSIVGITFFVLWRLNVIASWQWAAGFAQTAMGFVLSTFSIEPHFDALSSGMIFIGASYCYGSGILAHFGMPKMRKLRLTLVVIYSLCLVYFVFVAQSLTWQLFLTDAGFALLLAIAVVRSAKGASRPVDIALILASIVVVLDSVVRTVFFTFFATSSDDFGDFAHSTYNLAVHVTTITVCMVFPFTALGAIASAAIDRHREDAERDPLTGLLNRRGFENAISKDPDAATSRGVALICDIDHFKKINDNHGHACGDVVIVACARELERTVQGQGYVSRVGGEEFAVYLPEVNLNAAQELAEQIRLSFSSRDFSSIKISDPISLSCGLAERRVDESAVEAAFRRADDALYTAKSSGRNKVVVFGAAAE